ncbi:uncharacterized protein LOC133034584 [Cannabis sativa]|uniref:uncharacterized protein LOC133034584 n=1 Tax=Cannabis sativa TaxID=3483 RepID=UPI0029CA3C73|nr:uncharacterized protein LOC133034584 [Cannabis sativa]
MSGIMLRIIATVLSVAMNTTMWDIKSLDFKYREAKENYSRIQGEAASNPTDVNLQQAASDQLQQLQQLQKNYSSFVIQQSKIIWVKFCDENSSFFHVAMRKRKLENRITTFTKGNTIEDDFDKVRNHFISHFKQFMGSRSLATSRIDKESIKQGTCLNLMQQVNLIRPFSKSDVKKAIFSIHSSKSPGLDGLGRIFLKIFGGILVANPKSASDYRPIACCNTIYKCISKIICTRLSEVLASLVQSNQGAFVKNRLLAHNIMIFQDLLKGYSRKNISARCIMKIDLSKAYDTVDWLFVEDLLKLFCFPSRFISWIMTCLKGTCDSQ